MKTTPILRALALVLSLTSTALNAHTPLNAQVPQIINYQGRVAVGPTNFEGSGAFKFALVDAVGTTSYWSNDDTSTAGSEPASAVSLTVTKGLYSVLLGDTTLTNMTAIPNSVFANPDVRLRVWFDDGTANDSQLLSPDQRIAAVGYAMVAGSLQAGANISVGAVTATSFTGDGAGLTNIPAEAVVGIPVVFSHSSAQTVGSGSSFVGLNSLSSDFNSQARPIPFDGSFSTVAFSIGQNLNPGGTPISPAASESVEVYLVRVPKTVTQTYGAPKVTTTAVMNFLLAGWQNGVPALDSTWVPQGTIILLAGVLDSTNKHSVVSAPLSLSAEAGDLFSVLLIPKNFSSFMVSLTVVYQKAP